MVESYSRHDNGDASAILRIDNIELDDMRHDLDALSELVMTQYAFRDQQRQPWLTWSQRHIKEINNCVSFKRFATIVSSALDELRDFHAEVQMDFDGRWLPVPTFTDFWAEPDSLYSATIMEILEGSAADSGRVRVGDRVVGIDGVSLEDALGRRLGQSPKDVQKSDLQWALMTCLTGRRNRARSYLVQGRDGKRMEWELPAQRVTVRFDNPLTYRVNSRGIAVVRLNNSLGDLATVASFDEALAQVSSVRGLILDLRFVPSGGVSSVALGLMGRLISRRAGYQRHEIFDYGQPGILRSWVEEVTPRGSFQYQRPMIALVGRWTGSMGEGIAIGLDATKRALVAGTPMAGLAGATRSFTLPHSKLIVAFPCERLFHLNGTPREKWIPAPLPVDRTEEGRDMMLAVAESFLETIITSGMTEKVTCAHII